MTDPRSGFSDSLILRELQNIHEALTKTKERHTLNFRMISQKKSLLSVNLYLTHPN